MESRAFLPISRVPVTTMASLPPSASPAVTGADWRVRSALLLAAGVLDLAGWALL